MGEGRLESSGGLLWTRQRTVGFYKMRGISWKAEELLASQEGNSSTELVFKYEHFVIKFLI